MAQYHRDGFLLASGLVSETIARKGEDAMWDVMEMDRDDSESWDRFSEESRTSTVQAGFTPRSGLFQFFGNQNPDLLACYTPEMMSAMAQLTSEPVDFKTLPGPFIINSLISRRPVGKRAAGSDAERKPEYRLYFQESEVR